MIIHYIGTGFFIRMGIIPVVKKLEFISNRMLYIALKACWCGTTVLIVHESAEDKCGDMKGGFYEEVVCVFSQFPKYHMKIFFRRF